MMFNLKSNLLHNAPLKVLALIFGYAFWAILSQSHSTTVWLDVPLCFYNAEQATVRNTPETVTVQIAGNRQELSSLDWENLAVHIDLQTIPAGQQPLRISAETLFLPETIKLLHYVPSNVSITIEKKAEPAYVYA